MPFKINPKDNTYNRLPCVSREHFPPTMICLPGGEHIWQCPRCGEETRVFVPVITCVVEEGGAWKLVREERGTITTPMYNPTGFGYSHTLT